MIPWGILHVLLQLARRVREGPGDRRGGREPDGGGGHRA